jgi:hypothetical protein
MLTHDQWILLGITLAGGVLLLTIWSFFRRTRCWQRIRPAPAEPHGQVSVSGIPVGGGMSVCDDADDGDGDYPFSPSRWRSLIFWGTITMGGILGMREIPGLNDWLDRTGASFFRGVIGPEGPPQGGWMTDKGIEGVINAAIHAHLTERRDLLFDWGHLDGLRYRLHLQDMRAPLITLRHDLEVMNMDARGSRGFLPLACWMENAVVLSHPTSESLLFAGIVGGLPPCRGRP